MLPPIRRSGNPRPKPEPGPSINEIFPDIWADSTHGEFQLYSWAAGRPVVILGQPSSLSHTWEVEVVDLAMHQNRFDRMGCKLLCVTQSDPVSEQLWVEELNERYGIDIRFPIVTDEDGRIADLWGFSQEGEAARSKAYVLSADMRVRAAVDYCSFIPRSAAELLRVTDAVVEVTGQPR